MEEKDYNNINNLIGQKFNYIITINDYIEKIKEIYKFPICHKKYEGYIINLANFI